MVVPTALTRRAVALVVACGCALGAAARIADEVVPKWVGNLGATWFIAGFLAGRLSLRPREGAHAGALCLVAATVVYYALRLVLDDLAVADLFSIPLWWLAAATAIGLVSGWMGARSHASTELWGAPASVFLGEAVAVLLLRARVTQAVVELLGAVVCLRFTKSAWRKGLALTAAMLPIVAVFATYYRLVLGWRGPSG